MKKKSWSVVDTLFWLGGGLVATGTSLWSLPAGLIVAGVFCLVGAVLVDLSANLGREKEGKHA